jgi:hypothetical protein
MSIKEQFYNRRPLALFDPRGALRLDPRYTFTRGSSATFIDSSGIIRTAAANEPRLTYDPATGDSLGLLIEKQRTNHIRNNTMQGAVAGTPGTLPTNWSSTNNLDIATEIVDVGIENRINYIDIKFFGTTTGLTQQNIFFGPSNHIAAIDGQDWTASCWVKLVAGAPTNTSGIMLAVHARNSGFTFVNSLFDFILPVNSTLTRYSFSGITAGAIIAYVQPMIRFTADSNVAIDFTLRIGLPQLEQGASTTSVIPTSGSAATRSADILALNNQELPSTGSIYIDARTTSAGADETLLSVANTSDEKLTLAIRATPELFNSPALVYEIDDNFEPALPFPIPIAGDQRNLITFGETNTHYQVGFSRQTPTLASAVPENLNRLGIGHDVTDPTKGFNGTISRLYLWPGEIPPEIARGLVRGDFQLIDAASPNLLTPDAHSLVFNTQGLTLTGDRKVTFQLLGANNSVTIDWGDGTSEAYSGAAANTTISHTYAVAGLYLVQITGPFENIRFSFANSQAGDLVAVRQNSPDWTPTSLLDLYNGAALLPNDIFDNFPATASITNWSRAFLNLSALTTFPLLNTSAATSLLDTWFDCSGLTAFPQIVTNNVTTFAGAWFNCSSLTTFPQLDTSSGTTFQDTWLGCSSLTTFPQLDTSSGTNFQGAWFSCSSLTTFPELDFSSTIGDAGSGSNGFEGTWRSCASLADFPAGRFDNVAATNFAFAFTSCALTAQSIENILISINTANTSNGVLDLDGGTNAQKVNWTQAANDAYDALIARGWTITFRA